MGPRPMNMMSPMSPMGGMGMPGMGGFGGGMAQGTGMGKGRTTGGFSGYNPPQVGQPPYMGGGVPPVHRQQYWSPGQMPTQTSPGQMPTQTPGPILTQTVPHPTQPTNKYANNGITNMLGAAQQTVNPAATPTSAANNTMGALGNFGGRSLLPQNNNTIPYEMQATDNYAGFYAEPYAALKPGMKRSDLGKIGAGNLGASAGFM